MGQTVGVQLLGSTTLIVAGKFVELGSVRQRRLLAALALDAGAVVSADRLADRVWADGELPDDPRRALRTNLARLRQAIGNVDAIATEPTGWRLDATQVELDSRRFDELVAAAAEPGIDVHGRLARLDEALALWRGGAYEDMAGEDWVRAESTRLEELKLTAVERRYDAMLAAGMHTDALPGLAGEVDANPLRDRLVGLQMLALYRSGRQAEATRVYEQHRRHLADELGLEPGEKLHELDSRIVAGDPSLHLTSTAGTPLRSYRLGEQLGEGAFAVVYRGTQPSVGRDVAVKVIRAELANRPEFVRRFEAEAHLVARLEHPYIVPLYDYWREPDRACLVLRYLRGGTLEARLTSGGPLSLDACATMVEQIGSALAAAHAEGVVHRDVKPANVFLDEVGNFYLGDFGIALEAAEVSDPTAALSAGSPAYASPEQLRREPVGPPADVHGLAISIYESLTGRLPFPAAASQAELLQHQLHDPIPDVRERRGEVPAAVDAVIQRATAKLPGDRYQTVEELMAEFEAALQADQVSAVVKPGSATVITTAEARNPYKGLRAFTEADSGDFHGRERLVDRLLNLMSQTGTAGRIATVVGPSGIGKSSVVRAGLLPALRRGQVPTSDRWFVATMLPGSNPFDELAAALLRVATHAPDNMMGMLTDDRRGIARVVKALVPDDDGSDVLLVIDQFEELFTLTAQADTVRFLDALEHAVTDTRCPLRVVLTMRADFWDRPLRHGAFARLIDASTVNVTALAPDELERAIVAPAHHFGVEFEPGLVSEIVADVNDQPGALPLLQYALTELWDRRVAGVLTRDAYRELGGVTGALARRAEELYVESTPDEQHAARRLFGRLVTLGEGTEDVRRRAVRNEVGDDDATASVIDRFGRARLFSFDHDPSTREPTLEVAHEALIREWPRLRSWLDKDRDGLRVHRHLTDTTNAWLISERDHGELYRGGRLEGAEMWADGHHADLNADEREFLDASVTAHKIALAAEQEHLNTTISSNRRLRILVSVATVIAVIAAIAGIFALQQRSRADDEATEARAQADAADVARAGAEQVAFDAETARLVAQSASFAESNPRLAALLAVTAYDRDATPETLGSLQTALVGAAPLLGHIGWGHGEYIDIEYLINDRIVAIRADGLDLYDRTTGALLDSYEVEIGTSQAPGRLAPYFERNRVEAATDQPLVTVADRSNAVIVLDVHDSFNELHRWPLAAEPLYVAVDPAGERIAATDADWNLHVWNNDGTSIFVNRRGPRPQTLAELTDPVFGPEWAFRDFALAIEPVIGVSFVGERLFVSDGAYVSLLDASGATLSGPTLPLLEFAPEVFLVPTAEHVIAVDGSVEVYGIDSVFSLPLDEPWPAEIPASFLPGLGGGGSDAIVGVMPGERGTVVVTDNGAIFSMTEGVASEIVETQDLAATSAARADNEWAISTTEGIVLVSELAASPLARAFARPSDAPSASVSRNGDLVVAGAPGAPGSVAIWETATGRLVQPTPDVVSSYYAAIPPQLLEEFYLWGFEVDGDRVAHIFRPDDGELEFTATIADPAGATGGDAKGDLASFVRDFVDIQTRGSSELVVTLPEPLDPSDATFHPTNDWLLAGSSTAPPVLYDTTTWEPVDGIDLSDESIALANWSLDGELVATAAFGESITIRDGDTFEPIHEMDLPSVNSETWSDAALIFSEDNSLLLTNVDGVGRLWDVATGEPIGGPFPNEGGNSGVNWGTIPQLVTVNDNAVLLWNLETDTWRHLACVFAGSNLTPAEWKQWGPRDQPSEGLCAE